MRPIGVLCGLCVLLCAAFASTGVASPAGGSAAAPSPSPSSAISIGGVTIGASVLPLVKRFGLPDIVQTEDDGHFWQWSTAGGLDRELIADDDLSVISIAVTHAVPAGGAAASPTPAPADMPLLGADLDGALSIAKAAGATSIRQSAGPTLQWQMQNTLVVAEFASGRVMRVRGIETSFARALGYFGRPSPAPPVRHAVQLLKQVIPPRVPPGAGTVIVRVEVDASGKVTNTLVVLSSGDVQVNAFEQESMRLSKFAPATCDGTPCSGVYIDDGGLFRGDRRL